MLDFVHAVPACRVVFGEGKIDQVLSEVERLGAERVLVFQVDPRLHTQMRWSTISVALWSAATRTSSCMFQSKTLNELRASAVS